MHHPTRVGQRQTYFDHQEGADAFGDLPEWDLSDLYTSTEAKEFKRDMDWLESACSDFAKDYEGKMDGLDAAGMLEMVLRYEKIDMISGRIMSFAGLRYYQNTTDAERAQFMANAQDKITTYTLSLIHI